MKRWLILLMLLGGWACASAQADLYGRYAAQRGVKVASVEGFEIDSLTRVDVTLIEATDDEGWDWMKKEFYIAELSPRQELDLEEGYDALFFTRRSRRNPGEQAPVVDERIDVGESCYMGVSYLSRTVYIFCADSEEEYDAVATLLVKKIMRASSASQR